MMVAEASAEAPGPPPGGPYVGPGLPFPPVKKSKWLNTGFEKNFILFHFRLERNFCLETRKY